MKQDRRTKAQLHEEIEELAGENDHHVDQAEGLRNYIAKLMLATARLQGALVAVSNARGLPPHVYHIVDDAQAALAPKVDGKPEI